MSTLPIQATPVVFIEIKDGAVRVNGEPVEVADGVSLHQAGVHAAAERVAQVLDRPVRAIATDEAARTQLVVHPDGTATDVEVLEHYPQPSPEPVSPAPVTPPRLAQVIQLASTDQADQISQVRVEEEEQQRATCVAPEVVSPAVAPAGTSGASRRALLLILAVAVLVALTLAVVLGADRGSKPAATAAPTSTPVPTRSLTPMAPVAVARTVRVRATGDVGLARLRVTASRLPAPAVIVVVDATGRRRTVRVRLTGPGQAVVIRGLHAGVARWKVSVTGGTRAASGSVRVRHPQTVTAPPASAPVSQPSYAPPASTAPAPSHHHHSSGSGPVGPGGGGATGPVR